MASWQLFHEPLGKPTTSRLLLQEEGVMTICARFANIFMQHTVDMNVYSKLSMQNPKV